MRWSGARAAELDRVHLVVAWTEDGGGRVDAHTGVEKNVQRARATCESETFEWHTNQTNGQERQSGNGDTHRGRWCGCAIKNVHTHARRLTQTHESSCTREARIDPDSWRRERVC